MSFSISHWEELSNGILVPVCQPNDLATEDLVPKGKYDPDVIARTYAHISLKDINHKNEDARYCRKLLKNGFTCTLIKTKVTSLESDLMSFLYYHIRLKPPKLLTEEADFYFMRNINVFDLSESCYASDDHGIALLKMVGRKLRCCYIDLCSLKPQFKSVNFLPAKRSVFICKGSVWVIQRSSNQMIDIHLLSFNGGTTYVQRVGFFLPNSIPVQYSNFFDYVTVSQVAVMYKGHPTFIFYDASKMSLICKDLPDELFSKAPLNMVVGNLCLLQEKDNSPPKVYILSLIPNIKVLKVIDFSEILPNYKEYLHQFELSLFSSGMKAVVKNGWGTILIINLLEQTVSQILNFVDCFWMHKLSIQCSQNGKEIRLIGKHPSLVFESNVMDYLCVKYNLWNGMSLKDLSKRTILDTFSLDEIKNFNLPRFLLKELEDSYI